MSRADFEQRINRIQANKQTPDLATPGGVVQAQRKATGNGGFAKRFVYGILASAVVMALFGNIQALSDAAPEWVKNRFGPGAGGIPIAVLTIVWIPLICIRFVTQSTKAVLSRYAYKPSPFVLGAFGGLCAGLFVIKGLGP